MNKSEKIITALENNISEAKAQFQKLEITLKTLNHKISDFVFYPDKLNLSNNEIFFSKIDKSNISNIYNNCITANDKNGLAKELEQLKELKDLTKLELQLQTKYLEDPTITINDDVHKQLKDYITLKLEILKSIEDFVTTRAIELSVRDYLERT